MLVGLQAASAQVALTELNIPLPESDPLASLKPEHPRLLMTVADWKSLAERQKNDPELAKVIARIETDAQWLLKQPPLVYEKKGKRLLDVSRQAVQRILLWGVTYRLTGDKAYADRTKQELLNLAGFKDWNPPHFLDTAEMTAAMALGYDWFYDELDVNTRARIRQAIAEKGIKPGLNGGWQRSQNNWNQVCFGGLTLGALAIGDEAPEPARQLLELARKGIVNGLKPYAPDGVYPEGPGYWEYGTEYQVLMIEALRTALGTDWNLPASPGFLPSAAAISQLTGPTKKYFNFFDCTERQDLQPAMFWFARELEDLNLLRFQREPLEAALSRHVENEPLYRENRFFSLLALWWRGLPEPNADSALPLIWRGEGSNPIGVFRTSWTNPWALYLAFKGGAASLSHGHMDAGSFVLDSDGVRWAVDLGRQDYLSLESKGVDLWNGSQHGGRWTVFRLNNFSHNTLTIGDQLHWVDGHARITEFDEKPIPRATVDLSPVFAGQAERVIRSFELSETRTVSIQDELTGVVPGTKVRWAMATRATVEIAGTRALLKQDGKMLEARLVSPAYATFEVIPADPPVDDFNAPNPNTRILLVNVTAPESGKVKLKVTLQPGSTRQAALFPGRVFHVDADSGDDARSGTEPENAWRTLARVNQETFQPGDRLLFKAGTRYRGRLNPQGSGKLVKGQPRPIRLGKYGEGPLPRIDGQGEVLDTLLLRNVEFWEVADLEITNLGTNRAPWRTGVRVVSDGFGRMRHIHLRNLFVHDVNGDLRKEQEGCGIYFETRGRRSGSHFDDLLVERCRLLRTDRNGICQRNGSGTRSQRVVIRGNWLEDIGGDGIKPWGSDAPIVEYNIVRDGRMRCDDYAAGIWPFDCDDALIQFNEVSGMRGTKDGQGFDSDYLCRRSVFQYNYSHDNEGGFMLICSPGNSYNEDTIIRYNISQNDGINSARVFHLSGTRNAQIYNNTIYVGPKQDLPLLLFSDWDGGHAVATKFYNNIFYVDGRVTYDWGPSEKLLFANNVYYGNHIELPPDPNLSTNRPPLVNPGSGGEGVKTLVGYRPTKSLAFPLGRPVSDHGGRDFFGHPVPTIQPPYVGAVGSAE